MNLYVKRGVPVRRDRPIHRRISIAILVLSATLLGCQSSSPPPPPVTQGDAQVTDITLGRELGPDGMIAENSRTNSFWTTDKFYVAVTTDGSVPGATVKARWTFSDGSVAAEDAKTVDASGPVVTLLQAAGPEGRWKAGDYKVEIFVNDVSAGAKDLLTH
jgi:hypothetical protein